MIFPTVVTLLFEAALCLVASAAATNYSVDDQDPLFQYFGSWQNITGNLDEDGGHRLTTTPGSFATITYTCAYFYSMIIRNSLLIPFPPFLSFLLFLVMKCMD